jgi:hypothetical protein
MKLNPFKNRPIIWFYERLVTFQVRGETGILEKKTAVQGKRGEPCAAIGRRNQKKSLSYTTSPFADDWTKR